MPWWGIALIVGGVMFIPGLLMLSETEIIPWFAKKFGWHRPICDDDTLILAIGRKDGAVQSLLLTGIERKRGFKNREAMLRRWDRDEGVVWEVPMWTFQEEATGRVSDTVIFYHPDGSHHCVDVRTGALRWRHEEKAGLEGHPTLHSVQLRVAYSDGSWVKLDVGSGEVVERGSFRHEREVRPFLEEGRPLYDNRKAYDVRVGGREISFSSSMFSMLRSSGEGMVLEIESEDESPPPMVPGGRGSYGARVGDDLVVLGGEEVWGGFVELELLFVSTSDFKVRASVPLSRAQRDADLEVVSIVDGVLVVRVDHVQPTDDDPNLTVTYLLDIDGAAPRLLAQIPDRGRTAAFLNSQGETIWEGSV